MKPGRELDALVAEKVMGLVLQPITVVDYKGVHTEPGSVVKDYTAPDGRKCRSVKECPHYSTSIADAWLVVEKLQCQGHDGKWFFRLDYDCVETWDCAFYKESTCDGGYPEQWATALTAPHAICLAALKAVGVEEP